MQLSGLFPRFRLEFWKLPAHTKEARSILVRTIVQDASRSLCQPPVNSRYATFIQPRGHHCFLVPRYFRFKITSFYRRLEDHWISSPFVSFPGSIRFVLVTTPLNLHSLFRGNRRFAFNHSFCTLFSFLLNRNRHCCIVNAMTQVSFEMIISIFHNTTYNFCDFIILFLFQKFVLLILLLRRDEK